MSKNNLHKFYRWLKITLAVLILGGAGFLGWFFFVQKTADFPVAETPLPLRLAIDVWPGNFWVIVAQKKGYFAEEGVSVEMKDVSADYDGSLDELTRGELDANVLALYDLIELNRGKVNLVGILVTDTSLEAEGIAAKPEFARLSDLRGKRVGVNPESYLDFYLELAMANAGLAAGDYVKVPVNTDDLPEEFGDKNLDAAIAWQPTLGEMEVKYNLKRIFTAADIEGLSPGILVIPLSLADSRADDLSGMMKAWYRATEFIKSNPEEAMALVSEVEFESYPGHYAPEELLALMEEDKINDLQDNLTAFSFSMGSGSLYGSVQNVARYLKKNRDIELDFDIKAVLNPRFIQLLKSSF
ncbi:ABC transporter substrate-binding protein [Candidatus Peregrinibacteria bacterium]|nr:ABC transporter substrate-binding protein [Candidatus Peregrinibacteria bacterium]